jgi:DNA polymerase-3 subunit beta
MKHTSFPLIEAGPLSVAVKALSSVVEKHKYIPVLGYALSVGGKTTVTDLDMSLTVETGLTDSLIPLAAMQAALKGAPKTALVHMVPAGMKAELSVAGMDTTVDMLPAGDFPPQWQAASDPVASFTMPAPDLLDMLQFVSVAMSTEENRYYLNGAFLHAPKGALVAVATDGHRLAKIETAIGVNPFAAVHKDDGAIVPFKAVKVLIGLLAKQTGTATVAIHQAHGTGAPQVVVECGNWRLSTKPVIGTFPDYTRVVPQKTRKLGTLDRIATVAACKRFLAAKTEPRCAVALDFGQGVMRAGDSALSLPLVKPVSTVKLMSRSVTVGFDAAYLRDAFDSFGGKALQVSQVAPGDPARITDPAAPDRLIVQMPMRV